jgi:GNAT superfamily N-acetyltransferase
MTGAQPVIPDHFPPPGQATGKGVLEASVSNAEALWRAFAAARGHRVIEEPAWLAVDAGRGTGGTRVILRRPVRGEAQRASLACLVKQVTWPVVLEDPFGTIDLHAEGLVPTALSVMRAGPYTRATTPSDSATAEGRPGITVRQVQDSEALLQEADRIVVQGFPLASYQPYQPGRLLPVGLLDMPHISVFVASSPRGRPCGTCMTVKDPHGVGGVYWVAVLPEHRRTGVGRALMLAAMQELAGLPMVLCATPSGAPLYRALGFTTALQSTYWRTGHTPL